MDVKNDTIIMSEKQTYHKNTEEVKHEKSLIVKAQNNPKDFKPLYDQYFLQIFKYIIRRVKDENTAAEITSDVFAKAIFKIKAYQFKGLPFSSWLYRIAQNQIADYYRKNKSRKHIRVSETQLNYLIDNSEESINTLPDKEDQMDQLIASLRSLSDNELELIEMRFFEERSYKEMAEILNVTEGNARIRTHRSLNKLKNDIKHIAL